MVDSSIPVSREIANLNPRVIVTDAESRLGLYVIRALGRAGCNVTAVANQPDGPVIGFSSRHTASIHRLERGDYWQTLQHALRELAPTHDVVIPVSGFSIAVVLEHQGHLPSNLRSFLPTAAAFRHASDKRAVTATAESIGVPVPETYSGLSSDTIEAWAAEHSDLLPLVIKFSDEDRDSHWHPKDRYRIVRSTDALVREYRRMNDIASDPLVQEYVEGDGYGYFAIFDSAGEPAAEFGHRRLREYPVSGGPSTLCESVADPRLMDLGRRMLHALDWRGVAMVEFKRDHRSGEYKLLEINPRFWGSLPLALQCGINFPLYQVQLAMGGPVKTDGSYEVGAKMRFLLTDLLAVRQQWRQTRSPGLFWRYLKELADLSIDDGIFAWDDPRPFFTYLKQGVSR